MLMLVCMRQVPQEDRWFFRMNVVVYFYGVEGKSVMRYNLEKRNDILIDGSMHRWTITEWRWSRE